MVGGVPAALFRQPIQAFLHAGRAESGFGKSLAARRLAHALGCLCRGVVAELGNHTSYSSAEPHPGLSSNFHRFSIDFSSLPLYHDAKLLLFSDRTIAMRKRILLLDLLTPLRGKLS